jgi:hypothetical protein
MQLLCSSILIICYTVQWNLLNEVSDNAVIWLLWSNWPRFTIYHNVYNIHPFAYCYHSVNVYQFLSFPKVITVCSFLCLSDCKKPHSCFASVYFSITQILSIINDFWDFVAYNLYKEHLNKKCYDKIWFFLSK